MNPQMSFGQMLVLPAIVAIIIFSGYLIFKNNPEIMSPDSYISVLSDSTDDNEITVRTKLFDKRYNEALSASKEQDHSDKIQRVAHDFVVDENFHRASLGDEKGDWQQVDNLLIGHSSHTLKIFNDSGDLKWSFIAPTNTTFTHGEWPIAGSGDSKVIYAATEQGAIYAFDVISGQVHWYTRTENKFIFSPFIYGQSLFLPTEVTGGQKWALTPISLKTLEIREAIGPYELPLAGQPLKSEAHYIFATQTGHLNAVDLETEKLKWTATGSSGFRSSPTELGDKIYVGNEDGLVVIYDKKNGKKLHEVELGSAIQTSVHVKDSAGMGSAIDSTGSLITFDSRSTKRLWKYNLGTSASTLPHELLQLTYGSLHKLNFNSELKGWTIWAPCQSTHLCIFDMKKGQLLHRIDLQGALASHFVLNGDSLLFDVKEKDGYWLKKYVVRAKDAQKSGDKTAGKAAEAPSEPASIAPVSPDHAQTK